jgi:DNA-binding cell septation regulator SpoVG
MNKGEWGKIKAFFDLETEEGFTMKGFKLVQGINGLFVGFPSQKGSDEEYYDTIWADKELKDTVNKLAIDYYGQDIMPTDNNISSNPESERVVTAETTTLDTSESMTDDDIPF